MVVSGFSESYFFAKVNLFRKSDRYDNRQLRRRSNWSKCKRAAATLFILFFTLVLARAQSIGASAKTWIEIKAAHKAAAALANPNVTAKERLRVEQMYYQLVRDS